MSKLNIPCLCNQGCTSSISKLPIRRVRLGKSVQRSVELRCAGSRPVETPVGREDRQPVEVQSFQQSLDAPITGTPQHTGSSGSTVSNIHNDSYSTHQADTLTRILSGNLPGQLDIQVTEAESQLRERRELETPDLVINTLEPSPATDLAVHADEEELSIAETQQVPAATRRIRKPPALALTAPGSGAVHLPGDKQGQVVGNQSSAQTQRQQQAEASAIGFAAIAAISLPALGSVLADPLMSLVDTACVGQVSQLHLAALSPNTAIFNLVFQVFAFLGVTTTNFLASNSATAPGLTPSQRQQRQASSSALLCYALTIALATGVVVGAGLILAGPHMLLALNADPSTLKLAYQYLVIRALACPASMIVNVLQGACLGQQDAWTPLRVCAVAGMLNLVGDVVAILHLGQGVAGAAIATSAAQYLGMAVFLTYTWWRGKRGNCVPLTWAGPPSVAALKPMANMALTLLSRTMFTMLAFTLLNYAANGLGTLSASTHQVAMQLFWFLSFFPEPLSVAAQSLIAKERGNRANVRRIARLLLRVGLALSVGLSTAAYVALVLIPYIFTNHLPIILQLQNLVWQSVASITCCTFAMVFDGVCIGANDYAHLPRTNLIATISCAGVVFGLSRAGAGLAAVWYGLVVFFGARLLLHLLHAAATWGRSPFGQYTVKLATA